MPLAVTWELVDRPTSAAALSWCYLVVSGPSWRSWPCARRIDPVGATRWLLGARRTSEPASRRRKDSAATAGPVWWVGHGWRVHRGYEGAWSRLPLTTTTKPDTPSLRQRLHAATGDRDAEAKALADRSPDGSTRHDAKVAVNRAHGHAPSRSRRQRACEPGGRRAGARGGEARRGRSPVTPLGRIRRSRGIGWLARPAPATGSPGHRSRTLVTVDGVGKLRPAAASSRRSCPSSARRRSAGTQLARSTSAWRSLRSTCIELRHVPEFIERQMDHVSQVGAGAGVVGPRRHSRWTGLGISLLARRRSSPCS